jgi:hypothetical protein
MSDHSHSAPNAPPTDDRPGPDADLAGTETRVDHDAGTVTFVSDRRPGEETTAWLTVDADHVLDVADCR